MPQDGQNGFSTRGARQTRGASVLAENAVSLLNQRQAVTPSGARQFVLDHLLRAVTSTQEFDAGQMLDELRGHRLSVDAVIDMYVPAIARLLGAMWEDNDLDFAAVTVGAMRLQSLLSIASAEALDFVRRPNNSPFMLITIPEGEQHSLGAFVLTAQLRRLGCRVDMSFCERASDFVSRVICDPPDMVLFCASCRASLESVSQLVLDTSKVLSPMPYVALGGPATKENDDLLGDMSSVDLVSSVAKDAMAFVVENKGRLRDQDSR